MANNPQEWMEARLAERLDAAAFDAYRQARDEVRAGVEHARFCGLLSMASRYAKRAGALAPSEDERRAAGAELPGWDPERWTVLETARVALVLSRPDLSEDRCVEALEDAFRYADMGELCALYKSLAHLPAGERFVWRAGEGCRTNILHVFESVACDNPYPARHFDDVAWNQLIVKAVFVGAPLWRVHGLDERLTPELARMSLDLCDERRSAGRRVQPELWLTLGEHAGARGLEALTQELTSSSTIHDPNTAGRQAAAIALARAGATELLAELAETEQDAKVAETMRSALSGETSQAVFRALEPELRS